MAAADRDADQRAAALDELTRISDNLGLYDTPPLDPYDTWQQQADAVEGMCRDLLRDWYRALGLSR